MINKRLLIKNLLAHNDECSFYDKKRQLNLHTLEGKAKFLKHICALSNSNATNNSYIVVGVEDANNEILGTDFFDDSKIQNLVNAYLENAPRILYENIRFPTLPKDKVVGLVTIKPQRKVTRFQKSIYTIYNHAIYVRIGSNTVPIENMPERNTTNANTVFQIENSSRNNIKYTLDGVIDFMNHSHKDMYANYNVFKELFVICWAGIPKKVAEKTFLSRVDIALVNEQIKLFYSSQDVVEITYDEHAFMITEYVPIGFNHELHYYPLEQQTIQFFENGYYKIENRMLFEPPQFDKLALQTNYSEGLLLLDYLKDNKLLMANQLKQLEALPSLFMICYLNGFEDAKQQLIDAKLLLKPFPIIYNLFKEALRILRKMKYEE
jgi:hypothetical protein